MTFEHLQKTIAIGALLCWGLFQPALQAQISIGGKPYSFTHDMSAKSLTTVTMPGINLPKLQAEDEEEALAGIPPRFGDPIETDLNMENSGQWENLPDGGRLWRLSIQAPGAKSINLLYNDFYLPKGAVLYIYSADRKHVIGGFTAVNNKADRIFATGLVYSDHVVLEYYESPETGAAANAVGKAAISINYVVHGYRYIEIKKEDLEKAFDDSGNCNVNTICSQGDGWRDQIKSVAMILVSGFRNCTGYLVNNTAQDCRPLFLTANHCLGGLDAITNPNANTWTFMWRYESPNCTPDTDGPTNMTTSGATLIADPAGGGVTGSDFALLELAESPKDAGYDIYFAGFDATTTAPAAATGIHHPSGDVKKISMENAALTGTSYGASGGTATHWRVFDWDSGTTEPGSSGSPIFSNATGRAMGFLSGGGAACGNDLSDWYGQIGYSWDNNGATDSRRRLRDHLDPIGTGANTFVDGSADPCAGACDVTITNVAVVPEGCPNANNGSITITATTGNGPLTYAIAGPVNQNNGTGVFTNLPDGNYSITVTDTGVSACTATSSAVVAAGTDATPPSPVCITKTVILGATGSYTFLASDVFNQAASTDNCGTVSFVSASPASVTCANLNQTVLVTVTVNDGNGNTATCVAMVTVQEGNVLPPGWSGNNVGNANGSAGFKPCTGGGQFTVTASGFSTSSSDVLHLASRQLCGNGEIIARVVSVQNAGWAGISLRETLAQGSKMVALKMQSNGNIRRMIRATNNGAANNLNYFRPQHTWLRLVRSGGVFTGYTSINGVDWDFAFSATVSMAGCIQAGLFAESINGNVVTTAVFDHVTVTGAIAPFAAPENKLVETAAPELQVYPNPTSGEITLDLSAYPAGNLHIELYNVQGEVLEVVEKDTAEVNTERFDLSNYGAGIYLIRVQSKGLPDAVKRVIVQ